MNLITFPELFYLISTHLDDKEKIFLTLGSKITYNLKSLIRLDSRYDLLKINTTWHMCVKNIFINELTLESKNIIENAIAESIVVKFGYVKFISNNINVILFYDKEMIEELVSFGHPYLAMKIMLFNMAIYRR